ncbi:Sugar-specific transcriptional regulator TrmB [Agromyces sp. CF514]|uniref:transcriptional regulator TrmB n=1 Tax=Agromyces sp. CF514 TaxID=1881031 RepID=UPI0008E83D91|nr:transcriptional regulator TrmB [Agromyces sp. CF514]SFR83820.1 Sugar-specific transcriptional regulator TrmB [Agromyces sp. CF514]
MASIRHDGGRRDQERKAPVLDAIGLDDEHTGLYRLILQAPSASVDELAASAAKSTAEVRAIVAELERLGLLARQASAPDRVVASPPSLALQPMLLDRERRLTQAHEALVQLSEIYRRGAAQRDAPDVVDVVLGAGAVRQRFAQLQASATREVRVFVLSDIAFLDADENEAEDAALERGVAYRVIVEKAVLERPGFIDSAREAAAYGEEIRVLPTLPTRLIIADDDVAMLPMHSHGEERSSGALLVHPSGLLDLMIATFEGHWRTATEFITAGDLPGAHDAVDRDLLKLLLLGLTDAAAGGQLGISVRTVQRRVAELMETAGVTTRLQLGAEAVRRSWV